ncbi:hypothetical protein BCF44_13514 [Kutzneria buriramensis]|uniref:Uncharacterized protein n=1 Tax=Kutzneria buriramensis TaxID=1045776 RepID=A0A3E0GSQ3_9PSEU|nr:hypothetical protein BCF44_13514 [Kutzneria buriramensis]
MSDLVISYAGHMPSYPGLPVADMYPYIPSFKAEYGDRKIFQTWVQLSGYAANLIKSRLVDIADADQFLRGLLLRYGVRRLERHMHGLEIKDLEGEPQTDVWNLAASDASELLSLTNEKTCTYQRKSGRDLFCMAPSQHDGKAIYTIEGRRCSPTSRAVCRECTLPHTDYICSHLLHPEIGSVAAGGLYQRQVVGALCDQGMSAVREIQQCRAGGHSCWQRLVELEQPAAESISPLGLAESFDVLDAIWRLAFGRNNRLLALSTATGSAALSLGCANRAEFETRLSALADIVDRLKIDSSLLPVGGSQNDNKGSLDKLEQCLLNKLPERHRPAVVDAIRTIRRIRQARNAIQHGITEGGGLTAKLRELGIDDAPPRWSEAWDSIRVQMANALTTIRVELRQWVDSTS